MNIFGSSSAKASPQCQKCLQPGHWTYQCSNAAVYLARPSRSDMLRNPKIKPKPLILDDVPDIPRTTDWDYRRDPILIESRRKELLNKKAEEEKLANKKKKKELRQQRHYARNLSTSLSRSLSFSNDEDEIKEKKKKKRSAQPHASRSVSSTPSDSSNESHNSEHTKKNRKTKPLSTNSVVSLSTSSSPSSSSPSSSLCSSSSAAPYSRYKLAERSSSRSTSLKQHHKKKEKHTIQELRDKEYEKDNTIKSIKTHYKNNTHTSNNGDKRHRDSLSPDPYRGPRKYLRK